MNKKYIYLLPLGFENHKIFEHIASAITKTYGFPAKLISKMPMKEHTYNEGRGQYYSTMILETLMSEVPNDCLRLLAVTDKDLYVPQLNFVFGEAAVGGRVGIISLHRLFPEFYGDQPNEELLIERAVKEVVHELGHTFSLRHCKDPKCVMFFSSNIHDTDLKSSQFCEDTYYQLNDAINKIDEAA